MKREGAKKGGKVLEKRREDGLELVMLLSFEVDICNLIRSSL